MKMLYYSRRTFIAFAAIVCCTVIGLVNHSDSTLAIAGIAAAMCGGNAYEGMKNGPAK